MLTLTVSKTEVPNSAQYINEDIDPLIELMNNEHPVAIEENAAIVYMPDSSHVVVQDGEYLVLV